MALQQNYLSLPEDSPMRIVSESIKALDTQYFSAGYKKILENNKRILSSGESKEFNPWITTGGQSTEEDLIFSNDPFEVILDNPAERTYSDIYNEDVFGLKGLQENWIDENFVGIEQQMKDYLDINDFNPVKESSYNNEELLKLDIEDLLKSEGITHINNKPLRFGSRELRTKGNPNSHHSNKNPHTGYANARDISIIGGDITDYSEFRNILLNNQKVKDWMEINNWGIINELTPEILGLTKGTGLHFHFGPDKWAVNTWKHWLLTPEIDITKNFRNIDLPKNSSTSKKGKFSQKVDFVKALNEGYEKALSKKGLDVSYSKILVAQDAFESDWGKKLGAPYNYGGIKGKTGTKSKTTDYENNQYKVQYSTFRNFSSIDEYCQYKVNLLANNRYQAYSKYSSNDPFGFLRHILDAGYGGGGERGKQSYMTGVRKIYKNLTDLGY